MLSIRPWPQLHFLSITVQQIQGSSLEGPEEQEMQPTPTCCAFKNSERPASLGQASPGQKALSLHPLAKTHSSSQHVASTVQRKQERLWSQSQAPQALLCTPTQPCPPDLLTYSYPQHSPHFVVQGPLPSPMWGLEAIGPRTFPGCLDSKTMNTSCLHHHLEGSVESVAGRQELGCGHLS